MVEVCQQAVDMEDMQHTLKFCWYGGWKLETDIQHGQVLDKSLLGSFSLFPYRAGSKRAQFLFLW